MTRLKAARAISAFSHPIVVFPISVPFFLSRTEVSGELLFSLLPIFLALSVPILYFFYALKKKKISDWDMTQRRERYTIYVLSLIFGGLALWFLRDFESQTLFTLALIFYLLALFMALINFFWKISVHAAGVTAGALVFNLLLDQTAFLYFLIPLVVWSRREEKKHTWGQLLGGALLAFLVVFGVLGLRGARAPL